MGAVPHSIHEKDKLNGDNRPPPPTLPPHYLLLLSLPPSPRLSSLLPSPLFPSPLSLSRLRAISRSFKELAQRTGKEIKTTTKSAKQINMFSSKRGKKKAKQSFLFCLPALGANRRPSPPPTPLSLCLQQLLVVVTAQRIRPTPLNTSYGPAHIVDAHIIPKQRNKNLYRKKNTGNEHRKRRQHPPAARTHA